MMAPLLAWAADGSDELVIGYLEVGGEQTPLRGLEGQDGILVMEGEDVTLRLVTSIPASETVLMLSQVDKEDVVRGSVHEPYSCKDSGGFQECAYSLGNFREGDKVDVNLLRKRDGEAGNVVYRTRFEVPIFDWFRPAGGFVVVDGSVSLAFLAKFPIPPRSVSIRRGYHSWGDATYRRLSLLLGATVGATLVGSNEVSPSYLLGVGYEPVSYVDLYLGVAVGSPYDGEKLVFGISIDRFAFSRVMDALGIN